VKFAAEAGRFTESSGFAGFALENLPVKEKFQD
jgi:hypothetical protein